MITVLVHRDGVTRAAEASIRRGSRRTRPRSSGSTSRDARRGRAAAAARTSSTSTSWPSKTRSPKCIIRRSRPYDEFLYLILHGIEAGKRQKGFVTHDVDFFLGRNFLVTVHHAPSRSIEAEREVCARHQHVLAEGPVQPAAPHRRSDGRSLRARRSTRSRSGSRRSSGRSSSGRSGTRCERSWRSRRTSRRCGAWRCRSATPWRGSRGASSRRFPSSWRYRFRDVYDHLVRLTDEAIFLQDRVTGLLDAHLVDAVEPAESGHEGADGDRDDLHAAHGADGHVRHERHAAALPGRRTRRSSGGSSASWSVISGAMLWMFRRLDWL